MNGDTTFFMDLNQNTVVARFLDALIFETCLFSKYAYSKLTRFWWLFFLKCWPILNERRMEKEHFPQMKRVDPNSTFIMFFGVHQKPREVAIVMIFEKL